MVNEDSIYVEIKGNGDFILIDIIGYQYPNEESGYDANWLNAEISFKVGGFLGKFNSYQMSSDFEIFEKELKILYNNLNRSANFQGVESQVTIHIEGDGQGHLIAKCWLIDIPGNENELKCKINFDQTQIPKIINQLQKIIDKFPTRDICA